MTISDKLTCTKHTMHAINLIYIFIDCSNSPEPSPASSMWSAIITLALTDCTLLYVIQLPLVSLWHTAIGLPIYLCCQLELALFLGAIAETYDGKVQTGKRCTIWRK